MKIAAIRTLRTLFHERHTKRGYYNFVRASLGMLMSAIILKIYIFYGLERFELTTFDYNMRLRDRRPANEKVVLIDMGEDSIEAIGRWPWPRVYHATIISILSEFGAEAAVFDVIFSEPTTEDPANMDDTAMEEAMKKADNVYIPYAVELEEFNDEMGAWDVRQRIFPIDRFSKWAKGRGHITIVPDLDGTIRRIPMVIDYLGIVYPQLGLKVACAIMGLNPERYETVSTFFGRYVKIGDERPDALYLPVDRKNQMLVNWADRWGDDFTHYSFIDVITSYRDMREGKRPLVDLKRLEGKICIMGLTAAGLYDIKPNPLQPTYPAVGTNANIINSVLNRDFIRKAPRWLNALIIIFLGIILTVNASEIKPVRGALTTALAVVAYLLLAYVVLNHLKVWIAVVYPLTAIILGYLVIASYNQIVVAMERARLFALATKDGLTGLYVIRHFNLLLDAELKRIATRGGRLSALMCDLDHFKNVNDTYGHQAGDAVLKDTAGLIMSCCRQLDVPSRYGGEEFVVMLPGAGAEEALVVADRIRKRVERHTFRVGEETYKGTISIGAASYRTGDDRASIVKRADEALYKAKEEGRNRIVSAGKETERP